MDIYSIRVENLRALCAEKAHDNQSELAAALDKKQPFVNSLMTGKRKMGRNVARETEKRFGLEPGWMDREHASPTAGDVVLHGHKASEAAVLVGIEWEKLPPHARVAVSALIDTLGAGYVRADRVTKKKKKTGSKRLQGRSGAVVQ